MLRFDYKILLLLTTGLSLFACNFEGVKRTQQDVSSVPSPASETPSAVAELTEQCQGEISASVKPALEDYRLAQESDFVSSIRAYAQENPTKEITCSIFTADFNQDSLNDYALLLVAPDQANFRFAILLNQGDGTFTSAVTKDYQSVTNPSAGIIYTSMSFKPSGELGPANREYSPLNPETPEGKTFVAQPAIELWEAIKSNQTNVPQDLDLSTLAYCSEVFYFVDNKLKMITVCD